VTETGRVFQDHSQCSSHVVQGELLQKIDDDIDNVLGLSVFYQYVRTAALNQQQTQHVSVFTTELFAHYLHIRCLSVMKCRQLTQTSTTDEVQQYQKCFYESQATTTDVLLLHFVNHSKYPTHNQRQVVVGSQTSLGVPVLHSLDTSELFELLQQSAVEHLTTFRQLEVQEFSSILGTVTTDFEALYAYQRVEYQRCLQLSTHNVHTLLGVDRKPRVFACPEFIQLMDDDIASLIALALIVNPSLREDVQTLAANVLTQLSLSLYLMTQCQMKLHYSVASLDESLLCIEVARRKPVNDFVLDNLLLKLTERKVLLYISRE